MPDREAVLTVQGDEDMAAMNNKEVGLAVEQMPAVSDRSKDTRHTVVPFSFGEEARRQIKELKLWEQRSETVELELVGRR